MTNLSRGDVYQREVWHEDPSFTETEYLKGVFSLWLVSDLCCRQCGKSNALSLVKVKYRCTPAFKLPLGIFNRVEAEEGFLVS